MPIERVPRTQPTCSGNVCLSACLMHLNDLHPGLHGGHGVPGAINGGMAGENRPVYYNVNSNVVNEQQRRQLRT